MRLSTLSRSSRSRTRRIGAVEAACTSEESIVAIEEDAVCAAVDEDAEEEEAATEVLEAHQVTRGHRASTIHDLWMQPRNRAVPQPSPRALHRCATQQQDITCPSKCSIRRRHVLH